MTEATVRGASRLIPVPPDPVSITQMVGLSIKPGASVFLVLNESTMNVFLDRLGDWTITVALSARSATLQALGKTLEEQGFFKAVEQDGKLYYLWTSALLNLGVEHSRNSAEEKLLETLKMLQSTPHSSYIC